MTDTNRTIAALFHSIAERLEARRENPHRIRAYRRAADALLRLTEDITLVTQRGALREISGIGKDLASKIEEFLATGTIHAYEQLHRPLPTEIAGWTTLPGLTEAAVQHLYFDLGITTLDDLQTLVRSHFLRTLPGIVVVEDALLEAIHARLIQQRHSSPPSPFRSAEGP